MPRTMSLPIESVAGILLRLPTKSLVRFRSVSKEWSSLSSDPYLEKLLHQSHLDWKLIARHGQLYSLYLGSLDCALRADHILQNSNFTVEKVRGCSGGKLCFSLSDRPNPVSQQYYPVFVSKIPPVELNDDTIVICDLSTGARRIVSPTPVDFQVESLDDVPLRTMPDEWRRRYEDYENFGYDPAEEEHIKEEAITTRWTNMWKHSSYGFGFSPSSGDHKLVRISQNIFISSYLSGCENYLLSEAKVYSTKTDSWSRVDQDISRFYFNNTKEPVVVSGVLYWLAGGFFMATEGSCGDLVVAFDLAEESFRVIGHDNEDFYFMCLGSTGGKLCALGYVDKCVILLNMEDHGDVLIPWASFVDNPRSSWNFDFCSSQVMTFSKNGNKVLVDNLVVGFVCWDLAKETAATWQVKFV